MRLLGGLLIVCACALCGISLAGRTLAKRTHTEAMLSLLRNFSAHLQWGRLPLQALFADCKDPILDSTGFSALMRQANERDYPSCWDAALERLTLPTEAEQALRAFGQTLGRLPLEAQKEQTLLCMDTLERVLVTLRQTEKQKRHSTVALWTLAGLLIALLLL